VLVTTMATTIKNSDIRKLRDEAAAAGDMAR